jgi:hypothetical protein
VGGLPPTDSPFNVWFEDHDASDPARDVVCRFVEPVELLKDAAAGLRLIRELKRVVFP